MIKKCMLLLTCVLDAKFWWCLARLMFATTVFAVMSYGFITSDPNAGAVAVVSTLLVMLLALILTEAYKLGTSLVRDIHCLLTSRDIARVLALKTYLNAIIGCGGYRKSMRPDVLAVLTERFLLDSEVANELADRLCHIEDDEVEL